MAKTISTGMLTGVVVDGITINTSMPAHSSNYNNLSSMTYSYVVMHYTGNTKDTAKNNANYFAGSNRGASAHFFVDDSNIYQSVELRDKAWHCGGNTYYHSACRNANAIGIEMCCTAGNYKVSETTKRHAAYLCVHLCSMIGITAATVDTYVLRHYDVTHKQCPAQMAGGNNAEWTAFKEMVKSILVKGTAGTGTATGTTESTGSSSSGSTSTGSGTTSGNSTSYLVTITTTDKNGLNVRKGPGTNYDVVTAVKKGEVYTIVEESADKKWGKLKSGAGWIRLGENYAVKSGSATSSAPTTVVDKFTSYTVKIKASVLNIRKGPGTDYAEVGSVKKGEVYTIVEEQKVGQYIWGKLKSGAGWIRLDFTDKT